MSPKNFKLVEDGKETEEFGFTAIEKSSSTTRRRTQRVGDKSTSIWSCHDEYHAF